jgi:ABC-type cobalt transport system substrate-binding protein
VYGFVNTGKYINFIRVISLVLIGYTFLLGHRSFIVIGIIAIAFFFFSKQERTTSLLKFMCTHKLITAAILAAAFFFFFVKNVFAAFMDGNFELVISRLTSKSYYLNMLLRSEANSIIENLQYACQSNIGFEIVDYCLGFFALVPVLGGRVMDLFDVKYFETLLNQQFNDKYDLGFGMGSTFLGEAYSAGSFAFLIVVLISMFALISFMSRCLRKTKSPILYTWLSICLVYCSFYIFRNSSINLFVMMRAYLYIALACWLAKKLIPRVVLSK